MALEVIQLKGDRLLLLDQTLLPTEVKYLEVAGVEDLAEAIRSLRIRGAPALGVAAAFGLAMVALQNAKAEREEVLRRLEEAREEIRKTRPTAVNLHWALDRVMERARKAEKVPQEVVLEALRIYEENREADRRMGEHGSPLLEDGDVVLTHCNAGALATAGLGSALGVIKTAWKEKRRIRVIADETRPLLQGARLTSFEMVYEKIPVTVIADGAAAFAFQRMGVTKVIVGADRIAANGDTANKIGTYGVAVLARAHGVPFYVAAPLSTIDRSLRSGEEIPIEYRDRKEIEFFAGRRIVPDEAEVVNPAFDVTPAEYISGIITEKGVLRPPYEESIQKASEGRE
jgi:methylthioribose-1-phosphate isomerase